MAYTSTQRYFRNIKDKELLKIKRNIAKHRSAKKGDRNYWDKTLVYGANQELKRRGLKEVPAKRKRRSNGNGFPSMFGGFKW